MIRYAPLFLLCMLGLGCSKPAPPPPVPLPPTVTSVPGAAGLMRARGMTQHDGTIHIELGGRVTQVRVVRTDGHPLYPAWVDVLALPSGSTLVSVIDSRAESPPGFVVLPSDPDRGISVPYALEIRLPQEPPAPPVIEDPELYRALYDLPALNGALSTTESAPAVDPAATATTESDALLLDQSADSGPAGPFRECVTYAWVGDRVLMPDGTLQETRRSSELRTLAGTMDAVSWDEVVALLPMAAIVQNRGGIAPLPDDRLSDCVRVVSLGQQALELPSGAVGTVRILAFLPLPRTAVDRPGSPAAS